MQYINRVSNISENSFVLHFGIKEMIDYCGYNLHNAHRVTKALKELVKANALTGQQFYITQIQRCDFFDISNSPFPSLSNANFNFNTGQLRTDASGNILSVKIQSDNYDRDYRNLIIDGLQKSLFLMIPRAVVEQGEHLHYIMPFRGEDEECPAGDVKIIAFDFFFGQKTLSFEVTAADEMAEVIETINKRAQKETQPEDTNKGGWGTNKSPDIRYPEFQPTYNGIRLSIGNDETPNVPISNEPTLTQGE